MIKSKDSIEERRILPIPSDYFNFDSLRRATGEEPENFNLVVLKELLDNSYDIADERYVNGRIANVNIEASVEKTPKGFVKITVKDDGYGWTQEKIDKIKNIKQRYSSRGLRNYPMRGLIGHAWKFIMGIVHTFALDCNVQYEEPPITIISHGKRWDISVEYAGEEPVISGPLPTDVEDDGWASTVSVTLPPYKYDWWYDTFYIDLVEKYALFNPHAHIIYKGFAAVHEFNKIADSRLEFREFIDTHSFDTITERMRAEVKENPDITVREFVSTFRGFSAKNVLNRVTDGFPTYMRELTAEQRRALFLKMLNAGVKAATHTVLVPLALGKENLRRRMNEIDELPLPTIGFDYSIKGFCLSENHTKIPFVVECAVGMKGGGPRSVYFGINRGPKLSERSIFNWKCKYKNRETDLDSILKENGVREDDPISIAIHVICPNPPYTDLGKTQIKMGNFSWASCFVVDKASRFYKSLRKKIQLVRESKVKDKEDRISTGTMNIKDATFEVLPEAIAFVSSNGKYRFYARNLWYTLRDLFDKKGWSSICPDYKYFTPGLLEQFRREHPRGEENLKGLLKEASGELYEPRSNAITLISTLSVEDYKVPDWKYNKILVIEKRGFKGIITENRFHEKFDIAVIAGTGEGSFDARKLLKKVEKVAESTDQNIKLFCIHDADIYGLDIFLTYQHGSKLKPYHRLEIIDLGLTMKEALEIGLKPEKVPWPKTKNNQYRKIHKKITRYMPEEVKLMDGIGPDGKRYLNRVELNAFTPEQFLEWLTKKLEKHRVKEKVRPPDAVVEEKTREVVQETLTQNVKDKLWEVLGGDKLVEQLKEHFRDKWHGTDDDLGNIDVSGPMDEALSMFPTSGWEDIIRDLVAQIVLEKFEDEVIGKESLNILLKALVESKNLKN